MNIAIMDAIRLLKEYSNNLGGDDDTLDDDELDLRKEIVETIKSLKKLCDPTLVEEL